MFDKPKYQLKSFPFSSHQLIALNISAWKAENILDLGCDQGFIGRLLSYKPKKLVGVDLVKTANLKNYTSTHQTDLNKLDLKFLKGQKFEVIILADILEHLENPQKVLDLSLSSLKKDGRVIISVPNTGYWLVQILLKLHIRPRSDHGPFDRTHLHDFEAKSLSLLTKKAKLKTIRFEPTAIPLPLVGKQFGPGGILYFIYQLNYLLVKKWPNLFAYQLIVVCQPK